MKTEFKGVITALATPFKQGEIDLNSYRKLIRAQLDAGIQGFVVNGTTGESPTLTADEVKRLFECAKAEVAGQVPIIVGTGSNSTKTSTDKTREVSGWGADGVLVVVPYYNKPPQRGLLEHFKSIAEASKLPVILYNVPGRTITSLSAETVAQLSRHPKIVGIKEATGDMALFESMRSEVSSDFIFLSGDDATCMEFCGRGGHGVISVSSHVIGAAMVAMMKKAVAKDSKTIAEYATKFKDLMKWLYIESNPIPVKMALHWMGIFESPELRLPLATLDPRHHQEYRRCLEELDVL